MCECVCVVHYYDSSWIAVIEGKLIAYQWNFFFSENGDNHGSTYVASLEKLYFLIIICFLSVTHTDDRAQSKALQLSGWSDWRLADISLSYIVSNVSILFSDWVHISEENTTTGLCSCTWDLRFLLFTHGLTCKYRNLLLSKNLCAHRQTRCHSSPPSHKYGCLLCFGLRLLCLFHSRYVFFSSLSSSSFMQPLVFVWQKQLMLLFCNSAEYRAQEEGGFKQKPLFDTPIMNRF